MQIAVLIPCLDEALTVARVIQDFRRELPGAAIYVYDNGSRDGTAELARAAGAVVRQAPRRGKGHVVRAMFREVEADVYVLVDGDDTYPAEAAPALLAALAEGAHDMAVGVRLEGSEPGAFRLLHRAGNRLVAGLIAWLFAARLTDVLSGYRACSREFAKSVPLFSAGFEIETEMTLQALSKGFSVHEVPIRYRARPPGSYSKLSTWRDGARVLRSILLIGKDFKPLAFFGGLGLLAGLLGLAAGAAPINDYLAHRYVFHVPLAVLAAALEVIAIVVIGIGLVLDSMVKYHQETFELLKRTVVARDMDGPPAREHNRDSMSREETRP